MIEKRIKELTQQIVQRFKDSGYDVNAKEVEKRLKLLILEFKVPESEAKRTITNYLLKELDIPRESLIAESELVKVADITKPNQWVNLKVKVVQLRDSNSPSISQVGLVGDETGTIKFVIWAKADKDPVEEGKCYLFKNVVTDSFAGRMQINVNKNSEISEIDEEITLPPREIEVVGALISIQQNSGLIRRCKTCNRVISKGVCPIHGKVEGYDDLRIKGVIDDGENVYEVVLNEQNIKNLTGIGLKEAKEIAEEFLDRTAVLAELKKRLLGKYFKLVGDRGERYLIVKNIEFLRVDVKKEVEKLINSLEA